MADKFAGTGDSVFAPARQMFLITPHDLNEIDPLPKAIRANGAGNVILRAVDSTQDVTVALAAGEQLEVRAQFIRATGTTVAVLHGLA